MTHPRPKRGWRRIGQILTLAGVVPDLPGVEEAATGCYQLLRWNWGTPIPLHLPLVGHDNASARAGGRRRRSSQTLGGNGPDKVKVRQVWGTGTTLQTRTWGKFIMGSLMCYKRPPGISRVPVKKSGLKDTWKPSRWKAGYGESRTSGLERGKG